MREVISRGTRDLRTSGSWEHQPPPQSRGQGPMGKSAGLGSRYSPGKNGGRGGGREACTCSGLSPGARYLHRRTRRGWGGKQCC